jgi:hypothetical protein
MTEQTREKREAAWNRYHERKAARLTREARENRPVGKVVKEVKRRVTLAVDRVKEVVVPTEDPWNDDEWMKM